jgi:Zn finger protein HypA/HybF involved in hydrogenase expression
MAAIAKSWVETYCEKCEGRRRFVIAKDWVLVCPDCGETKRLAKNGLLAA